MRRPGMASAQCKQRTDDSMIYSSEELEAISHGFEGKHPMDALRWTMEKYSAGRAAMATGFGAEGVALIDMLSTIDTTFPIFFLDTDVLFPETYRLRETLEQRYGISILRYGSTLTLDQQEDLHGRALWTTDPDLCCRLRKVDPLHEALAGRDAWVTAIRREQSQYRARAGIVEWDKKFNLIKVNPLAGWTKREVWQYITERRIPYNPLYDKGYTSIGCTHCTTPVGLDEDERAGRWRGIGKTECGLHK